MSLTWHSLYGTVEGLVAVATAVGVLGGLFALGLSVRQLGLQTHELADQTQIRTAQRAQDLMKILIDLGHVIVEHPELAPYFHEGMDLQPTATAELRRKVIAHASGYMSFAEIVGWQIRANQMNTDPIEEWARYFKDLYDGTPVLQKVVDDDSAKQKPLLAGETRWLFGAGEPTKPLKDRGFITRNR